MESLQVRTGQISLRILDDDGEERGIFKFNPEDIESAKRLVQLQSEFQEKYSDFEKRSELCKTLEEKAEFLSGTVQYFKSLVDECFGEGSSKILFGDANTLSMFFDFFEGITPYYKKASSERMAKYSKPSKSKK